MKLKLIVGFVMVFLFGLGIGYAQLINFDLDTGDRNINSNLDLETRTLLINEGYSNPYFTNIYSRDNADGTTDILGTFNIDLNGRLYQQEDVLIVNNMVYARSVNNRLSDDEIIDLETRNYADRFLNRIAEDIRESQTTETNLGLGRREVIL